MPITLIKADADRARARGIENSRKLRPLSGAARIVHQSLQSGRKTRAQIVHGSGLDDPAVGAALARLRNDGLVIIIGKAEDIGAIEYRRNAPVYAVAGTPPLKEAPQAAPANPKSKNVAGRTYYPQLGGWGQWR